MLLASPGQQGDDSGLPPRVLPEYDRPVTRGAGKWKCLAPVQLDDGLADGACIEAQGTIRVVAMNDAQVRERVQQGKLVARDEASFAQQPLDLLKKTDLALGRDRCRHRSQLLQ